MIDSDLEYNKGYLGGFLSAKTGDLMISKSRFISNEANKDGSAVIAYLYSKLHITECLFKDNYCKEDDGGTVKILNYEYLYVKENVFINNTNMNNLLDE